MHLESRQCWSSKFVLFQNYFVCLRSSHFLINFRFSLFSTKHWLNLQINLGSIDILQLLSLQVHDHSMHLHLLRSSLVSLSNILHLKSTDIVHILSDLPLSITYFIISQYFFYFNVQTAILSTKNAIYCPCILQLY